MEIRQLLPALRTSRLIEGNGQSPNLFFRRFIRRRPKRVCAFSDITKSTIDVHVVNDQRKSPVFHFRNRIEFSDKLFDRDSNAQRNCIRPRRDARRRIGMRKFAPHTKSRPGRHSGHRSQQRLFVRIQLRLILPNEQFHLIPREVFRKPISRIRQCEDRKRCVELRGLHRSERIQKWLVLAFESFGVVTKSDVLGKGTEGREGTGTRGIIGHCG